MSGRGADAAMPPKKSKAARRTMSTGSAEQEAEKVADGEQENGQEDGEGSDERNMNIILQKFQDTFVEGKRKRSLPVAEQFLRDWLNKNFVVEPNNELSTADMYTVYIETCTSALAGAIDQPQFLKVVKELFKDGIALTDDSPYKDAISVPKKKKEKKMKEKQTKTEKYNTKELINEAITQLGNPRKGVRCLMIANNLWGRYPALRVAWTHKQVTKYIERELRFGHLQCVRGIGACGFYRLPRTMEEEDHEIEEEEKVKKEKEAVKKEKEGKKDSSGEGSGDETAGNKEKETIDGDLEKIAEGEVASGDDAKVADDDKKKKKKKKKSHKRKHEKVVYGQPKRIEDTFPLALTYNSEPKEASLTKIRKYLQQHYYKDDLNIDKLKRCLESGCERGYWLQVTGQTYQLTIEEFDPTADDDLTGQIMNAIVACTEPKISSSLLLKKYVLDYHPEFKVAERPLGFKKALQRAIDKNIIVQLSGIGAIGSFQLASPFSPSPLVLQGNDTESDYEADADSVSENNVVGRSARDSFNAEMFRDAYVPRPTKRHGRRAATAAIQRLDPSLPTPRSLTATRHKATHSKTAGKAGGKAARKAAGKKTAKKKVDLSSESESESESEEEDEKPEYTPRKSQSRGGTTPVSKAAANKRKVTSKKVAASSSDESDSEERPEYTPRQSKSRGGGKSRGKVAEVKNSAVKGKKQVSSGSSEESDNEVQYTPVKSQSRGGKPAAGSKRRHEAEEPVSSKKKKAEVVKGRPVRGKPAKQESDSEQESEQSEEEILPAKKGSRSGKGGGKGSGSSGGGGKAVTVSVKRLSVTPTKNKKKVGKKRKH